MFTLRLWLISLLLTLPLYTYSLNYRPRTPPEDVFEKRDLDEEEDLEKRQDADLSSILESFSDALTSIFDPSATFIDDIGNIEASLSSLLSSLDITVPSFETTAFSGFTSGPVETATPGQVITDGTRTGTVGEDGTTRFCSASSYLCPASVNYGCCSSGYRCGLTACTPTGGNSPQTTDSDLTCSQGSYLCPSSVGGGCCPTGYECGISACTPTGGIDTQTQDKTTFSFDPLTPNTQTEKAAPTETGNNEGGNGGGLSGGAIGGIVGGVVGGVALLAAGVVWFCLNKRKSPKDTPLAAPGSVGGPPPPSEQYTGGPLPPQPQMSQYTSPMSPPPEHQNLPPNQNAGGYYQPYAQQYPGQQGPPNQGGYPQYGQNVSELGGAAMPYGQKGTEPPEGIQEAPANPVSTGPGAPNQENQQGEYAGHKGPSGPVYELS